MILHTNVMARQQVPFVPWREFESWLLFRSYMVVLESHESLVFDRVYRFVLLAAMMDLDLSGVLDGSKETKPHVWEEPTAKNTGAAKSLTRREKFADEYTQICTY